MHGPKVGLFLAGRKMDSGTMGVRWSALVSRLSSPVKKVCGKEELV